MIVMSVTDFSRNIKRVLDSVETGGEEVVLVRNKRRIGTLVPGEPFVTAAEAMGDLYRTLPEDAAGTWLEDSITPPVWPNPAGQHNTGSRICGSQPRQFSMDSAS